MTRQLWKVRRQVELYFEDDEAKWGNRWLVTSPTGVRCGTYATHTEALERADTQSRTVVLELPRTSVTQPVSDLRSIIRELDRVWTQQTSTGVSIQHHFTPRYEGSKTVNTKGMFIPSGHVKPLALALLAHHYKETA